MTNFINIENPFSGAIFSNCRKYRFVLYRIWDKKRKYLIFIGLNPSTADENQNDNTVIKVINFTRKWGYGGVFMMNCYPYISTDPERLIMNKDYNKFNFECINKISKKCSKIIFSWGNFKIVRDNKTDIKLYKMFKSAYCLIQNKNGSPRHPLYVPYNTKLKKFLMPN